MSRRRYVGLGILVLAGIFIIALLAFWILPFEARPTLTVRVSLDDSGIEGSHVSLTVIGDDGRTSLPGGETSADGTFLVTIPAEYVGETILVEVELPVGEGFRLHYIEPKAVVLQPGETMVDMPVLNRGPVEINVRCMFGSRPVPGAEVFVARSEFNGLEDPLRAAGVTDGNGWFNITPPPEFWGVEVHALCEPTEENRESFPGIESWSQSFVVSEDAHNVVVDMRWAPSPSDDIPPLTRTGVEGLVAYLQARYDPWVGLLEASPDVERDTYYLVADNLWGAYALRGLKPSLADSIEEALTILAAKHGIPVDEDGFPVSLLHEAVVPNHTIPFPIHTETVLTLFEDDYAVKTVVYNSSSAFRDYLEYGDLPLYLALSEYHSGNLTGARELVTHVAEKWDGTGLNDAAHRADEEGRYETYKLALLLYVADRVGVELEFRPELEARIWRQQDPVTGGIHTHFAANQDRMGDTNVETTSLVLIAYSVGDVHSPSP